MGLTIAAQLEMSNRKPVQRSYETTQLSKSKKRAVNNCKNDSISIDKEIFVLSFLYKKSPPNVYETGNIGVYAMTGRFVSVKT